MKNRILTPFLLFACCTAARAADLTSGYVIGASSQLLTANGGAGTTLFADVAALGGTDVNVTAGSVSQFASVLLNGSSSWAIGDTVSITGFAMPLVDGPTTSGTFTFDIRQGAGGTGPSATAGLASIGTATAAFTTVATAAGVYYVNFDAPVTFVADFKSTSIVINWSSTGAIRYKKQDTGDLPQVNYGNGNFVGGDDGVRVSVAGSVTSAPDSDNDGLPDSFETGGDYNGGLGTLGTYNGPTDTGTFYNRPDSDGDGISDGHEVLGETVSGFSYTSNPTLVDTDSDTINDGDEVSGVLNTSYTPAATNPDAADTDNDTINDKVEISVTLTNPRKADTDDDGLTDAQEDLDKDGVLDPAETDPKVVDTDSDGLGDGWELANGFNPRDDGSIDPNNGGSGDPDSDDLTNAAEYNGGVASTNPQDPDSDNDGLTDGIEANSALVGYTGTNPLNRDSDGDRLGDKYETDNGLDPFVDADFDADTYSDALEVLFYNSNPKNILSFPGDGISPAPGSFSAIQDGGLVSTPGDLSLPGTLGTAIINEAAVGGNVDAQYLDGITDFVINFPNAFPAAGSTVSISGFAWPVVSAVNTSGDILLEFFDPGADGVVDGIDQDVLVGTAKGTLTVTGATTIMYWNFAPINFTSAGTALMVKIQSTGALRIKAQDNFASGEWYRNDARSQFGNIRTSRFSIGGTATLPSSGYSGWQSANSTAGNLDEDHDDDGVSNGVEYFLGGNTNTTGFTGLPGVTNTAGTLSVTWNKADTGYAGNYPADFVVETSDTLIGAWATAPLGGGPGEVVITGNAVKYIFPTGTKKFARLKVTGP